MSSICVGSEACSKPKAVVVRTQKLLLAYSKPVRTFPLQSRHGADTLKIVRHLPPIAYMA